MKLVIGIILVFMSTQLYRYCDINNSSLALRCISGVLWGAGSTAICLYVDKINNKIDDLEYEIRNMNRRMTNDTRS